MQKIEDVESYLEQIFSKSCSSEFPGYRIRVSLLDKNQRKKRKDASAWYWTPEAGGQILVSFEPEPQAIPVGSASAVPPAAAPPKTDPAPPRTSTALADLIRALNEAELRPGYGFIALKWFRDQVLPAVRPEWSAPDTRSAILRDAIERGLVLTSKVPNPKSPAFPVTAVRLNGSAPQVAEALGAAAPAPDEFRPIPIRGESLSKTILRERR